MSEENNSKINRRGRPAIGHGEQVRASFRPADMADLRAWIARQDDPDLKTSEAIRILTLRAIRAEVG